MEMWVQVEEVWMKRMGERGIKIEVRIAGRYMLIWLFTVTARKAPSLRSRDIRSSLDGIERKSL
jgi:hypothetical protein